MLIWWLAYMYRYGITPINIDNAESVQYIVKVRWTGEIEVVWQIHDGNFRRSLRTPFALA